MSVAIMTDSNSGITQGEAAGLGVRVVPMPFYINDEVYFEDITMSQKEFYGYLEQKVDVKTSQPTPDNMMKAWREALADDDELVYIPMSSGLSSTCETATMLSHEDEFEGKVFVVDNQRISVTQRRSTLDAKALADKGFGAEKIREILLREKFESSIYIMMDTLYYLKKGGRITPAAAAIGTLLKIRPVLQIQGEKLDAYTKVKTVKSGKQAMIKAIKKDMETRFGDASGGNCFLDIAYTASAEDVEQFRQEVLEEFPNHVPQIDPLSLSVACHIGPGALALAVSKKIPELEDLWACAIE
ncbi:MAG: DegV family protein [Eubacterium sp.]|nr:DegV family protein [Eubacterium sp.]